jgi:hypothetical protein
MDVLRNYLIRLYRHEPDDVAGTVESVETGEIVPFRSPSELHREIVQELASAASPQAAAARISDARRRSTRRVSGRRGTVDEPTILSQPRNPDA